MTTLPTLEQNHCRANDSKHFVTNSWTRYKRPNKNPRRPRLTSKSKPLQDTDLQRIINWGGVLKLKLSTARLFINQWCCKECYWTQLNVSFRMHYSTSAKSSKRCECVCVSVCVSVLALLQNALTGAQSRDLQSKTSVAIADWGQAHGDCQFPINSKMEFNWTRWKFWDRVFQLSTGLYDTIIKTA